LLYEKLKVAEGRQKWETKLDEENIKIRYKMVRDESKLKGGSELDSKNCLIESEMIFDTSFTNLKALMKACHHAESRLKWDKGLADAEIV